MNNDSDIKHETARIIAAVDLGSNSFHMIVASIEENGTLKVIDKIKEMVRLGAGLNGRNYLDEETQQRALDCLSRFSQRLQNIHKKDIRIAGTNTLRIAKNSNKFIKRARKVLNHRIDIISGVEEARLVYHGAVYSLAELGNTRLVVDIGGGSTEVIIGKDNKPIKLESLEMGCVSITQKFFSDGVITKSRLKEADIFARQQVEAVRRVYLKTGWEQCVGTSGSIRSISKVLLATEMTDGTITDKSLKQLLDKLLKFELLNKIKLDGLNSDRQPVFIGGVIVLNAIFKALKLKEMIASDGALREGLMLDVVGRIKHEDIREVSVKHLASRYVVRQEHAENVILSCKHLYNELAKKWSMDDENHQRILQWAASLHEIGLAISHSGYIKHSAYLVLNSDMPGFSIQEQQLLSLLVRYHRQKVILDDFEPFRPKYRKKIFHLMIILRLAVILNRSMSEYQQPDYMLEVSKRTLTLKFPEHWFDENPLTMADLENEIDYLAVTGFKLKIKHLKA
ncbi:MAG: exopolyphosphatase [Gammaproteobacteria bacterium]|nr:exopolyphosphatase [Gammaproteobacteria bacterium]